MTDAELIIASRADPGLFGHLYRRLAEDVLAYLYRRTFDAEVAADLLAESFAVAFERRHTFRDTGRPGAAWVYGIAANELSHWYRHQTVERGARRRLGLEVPALDDESIARIESLAEPLIDSGDLADALAQLSDAERRAVELRIVRELGYREIAVDLGCSEGAARTRVHRGLATLTSILEPACE